MSVFSLHRPFKFQWHISKIISGLASDKLLGGRQVVQSNLAIKNGIIRNKLVLRNHFLWPICHLLHKDKELMALRNNFRATKKFLIAKFDCIRAISKSHFCPHLQKNEPNHCPQLFTDKLWDRDLVHFWRRDEIENTW